MRCEYKQNKTKNGKEWQKSWTKNNLMQKNDGRQWELFKNKQKEIESGMRMKYSVNVRKNERKRNNARKKEKGIERKRD
jgi:hypothetical protein